MSRARRPACPQRAVHAAVIAVALLLSSGCATVTPPGETLAREVLLTVPQTREASIGLTGPMDTRYLRRRGYGAPPPDIDRVLDQLAKEHGLERKEGWPIRALDLYCEVFVVPQDRSVVEVVERLRADPRVDLAQPMNVFETLTSRYDDPYADLQPSAFELGLEQAHRLATGKGVRVAVIDSAVDIAHPELAGAVELVRDVVEPRRRSRAADVHGTAVAGVIASAANNGEGIVGIAPDAALVALRACWSDFAGGGRARCSSFTLAQALEIAIAVRADVINLSLTGPADPLLHRLVIAAAERGAVVVGAGPEHAHTGAFPATVPGVLVARASSGVASVPGVPLGLPAPADEILTTTPGGGYGIFSGTSLAAAHLSGIAALLREQSPKMEGTRIEELLRRTIVRRAERDTVNACQALQALADADVCAPLATASTGRAR